jgi:guanine deaminase
MTEATLHTGTLAHLRGDPFVRHDALEIISDGALAVNGAGRILAVGSRADVAAAFPGVALVDHGRDWLIPGLIDAHLHFPQFYATAAYGGELLDWLEQSILPAEAAYADEAFAAITAQRFVARLLASGTTTAMVFGAEFPEATAALLDAAAAAGLRLIGGITLMDRGAPEPLLQTVDEAVAAMGQLIARCRGQARLHYAITPRFALSCSPAMLEACGGLLREFPECYLQTHINENAAEITAVRAAFPGCRHYLDVYDRHGLIGPRTLLAHSIHTSDAELSRMAEARCAVCHCPSSNLFLGSGLFPLRKHLEHGIPVAVGTDVGAGPQFSVWRELAEMYKVQRLQGQGLSAAQLLYPATLGGARALGLEREIGSFEAGKCADFFVLGDGGDAYLAARLERCESLEARLFCLLHLAGAAEVRATCVAGTMVPRERWGRGGPGCRALPAGTAAAVPPGG